MTVTWKISPGTPRPSCRDALLMDAVPREAHDRPVELVVTEKADPAQSVKRNARKPCGAQFL